MLNPNDELDDNLKINNLPLSNKPLIKSIDYTNSHCVSSPSLQKNDGFLTPLRKKGVKRGYTPQTPYLTTPTQDPSINTPNGSKITHPFLSSIIRNLDKATISPGFFEINESSIKDDSVLSPDLSGNLFPVEMDQHLDTQYTFESDLFKKYERYCNHKADKFFQLGTIAPSPDPQDSGLGSFLQTSNVSSAPINLLIHNTPPSKYKWNKEEFRTSNTSPLSNDMSYQSCNDDSLDFDHHRHNMESTKIFDDSLRLCSNLSMRNVSIIESPMFKDSESVIDDSFMFDKSELTDNSFDCLRSSPNSRNESRVMDDLNLSPITEDVSMKSFSNGEKSKYLSFFK